MATPPGVVCAHGPSAYLTLVIVRKKAPRHGPPGLARASKVKRAGVSAHANRQPMGISGLLAEPTKEALVRLVEILRHTDKKLA